MPAYGIAVVGPGWNGNFLTLSPQEHKAWQDSLVPGTRALIYEVHPTQAIVAEVEIVGPSDAEQNRASDKDRGKLVAPANEPQVVAQQAKAIHDTSGLMAGLSDTESEARPTNEAHRIPVKVIHERGEKRIQVGTIRQVTTVDTFPREGEEWLPLGKSTYEELAHLLK
jgi:hypothetical protein